MHGDFLCARASIRCCLLLATAAYVIRLCISLSRSLFLSFQWTTYVCCPRTQYIQSRQSNQVVIFPPHSILFARLSKHIGNGPITYAVCLLWPPFTHVAQGARTDFTRRQFHNSTWIDTYGRNWDLFEVCVCASPLSVFFHRLDCLFIRCEYIAFEHTVVDLYGGNWWKWCLRMRNWQTQRHRLVRTYSNPIFPLSVVINTGGKRFVNSTMVIESRRKRTFASHRYHAMRTPHP